MAKVNTKIGRQVNPVIEQDEAGKLVLFTLPFAALHYDYHYVKLKDQDKVDDTMDELIELHYSMSES